MCNCVALLNMHWSCFLEHNVHHPPVNAGSIHAPCQRGMYNCSNYTCSHCIMCGAWPFCKIQYSIRGFSDCWL